MSLGIHTRTALTDEELARRYQATDDTEYFAQISARRRRLFLCACRRFLGCNSVAEDTTILEKGTAVAGFGATSGTLTKLTITGIASHGIHYKLRTDPGATALQPAGSGDVVQFQGSKVAELWLDSVSAFGPLGYRR